MKRLLNYLKPSWLIILIIIGLTYAQVQFDLALPDYMSNIVTEGIEYGGLEDNTLYAIRSSEMDKLECFLDEDIKANYILVKKGDEARVLNQIVSFKEDTYVLKEDYDKSITDKLVKPMMYVSAVSKMGDDSVYDLIRSDENYKASVIEKLDETLSGYEDNLETAAILYCQEEFKQVGLNTEVIETNYILHTGMVMLGISLLSMLVQIVSTYLATKTAAGVAAKIRSDVFRKVESFSNSEFTKFSSSSLITRTTNDITQIQSLVQVSLRMLLMAPMMGITSVFKVMRYPDLIWILIMALIVITGMMILTLVIALPKFSKIQVIIDKLNNTIREFLDGMLVIRAFNNEKKEEKRFDETNTHLTKTMLFVNRTMAVMMPLLNFLMNFVSVLIIWYGAKQIDINAMSVGNMMAFIQYATHVLMSFMIVAMIWIMIPRAMISARRVFEVLDTENTINDPTNPLKISDENEVLKFDNVSFKYPMAESAVLENISFEARPGETVAFIGSTGSGKSTLIQLIPRLYDVSGGHIYYGNHDIREYSQKDLREKIGYVTQRAILFNGDIRSNIEFGREVDERHLNEAIEVSQAKEFIDNKEDGVSSAINQGGTNVSGGQKQRLSIARALAKDASIYIFDDSFSALDYTTDKKLRNALKEVILKTKATLLIVAQRISTIKDADKIIVLDSGKIVGMGTHKELLKNCDVYLEIAKSQLSEEELANA